MYFCSIKAITLRYKSKKMKKTKKLGWLLFLAMALCSIAASSKPVTFRDCNKVTAPLRCKAIKSNGKQCLNASYKCDTVCKFHLNNIK